MARKGTRHAETAEIGKIPYLGRLEISLIALQVNARS
jgi:hypothetical protein